MAFVSFSSQLVIDNSTAVSNVFFDEYLPSCSGDSARVYLYGLYMCGSSSRWDNTIEHFSKALNLSCEDIRSIFDYWNDQGLVHVSSINPMQIQYLPVKAGAAKIKKYTTDKYSDFNVQIQSIIEGRMITANEFTEYYAFLESLHVQPAALVMIAKYCADLKGANVGYNYILTVAKNWAYGDIKTVEAVEEKLAVQEYDSGAITKILKNLKSKRKNEPNDYQLIEQWRLKGFDDDTLFTIATFCAKTGRGKIEDMDGIVERFFQMGLTTPAGIDKYVTDKVEKDKFIHELLAALGLTRNVANIDRDFYATWTDTWNFKPEIINYAATLAIDKASPMAYLNKILASWFEKKITTLNEAKKANYAAPAVNITRHSYSDAELKSLFQNIEEVKF